MKPVSTIENDKSKAIHLALRTLGNKQGQDWALVFGSIHGQTVLAINLNIDSSGLTEIRRVAQNIWLSE